MGGLFPKLKKHSVTAGVLSELNKNSSSRRLLRAVKVVQNFANDSGVQNKSAAGNAAIINTKSNINHNLKDTRQNMKNNLKNKRQNIKHDLKNQRQNNRSELKSSKSFHYSLRRSFVI